MQARVAIFVDHVSSGMYNWSWEEEIDAIHADLCETLEIEFEPVAKGNDLTALRSQVDFLVIDYGGLTSVNQYDYMYDQIRLACHWAKEHPGKLLILYGGYTDIAYRREFKMEFGDLDNVVSWMDDFDKIAPWTVGFDEALQEVYPLVTPGRTK